MQVNEFMAMVESLIVQCQAPAHARSLVEGFINGIHRGIFSGSGTEFMQYRPYHQGDELKHLDWKLYARVGEKQIRLYREETNCHCWFVLDMSSSMSYRNNTSKVSKFEYACLYIACLGWLSIKQGDSIGLIAYNEKVNAFVEPGSRRDTLETIVLALLKLTPAGQANHPTMFSTLQEHIGNRGKLSVLSDMLDFDDTLLGCFKHLTVLHHDVELLQVLDPYEQDFPFKGGQQFVDIETGQIIETAALEVKDLYQLRMSEHLKKLQDTAIQSQLHYKLMLSDQPIAQYLMAKGDLS